MNDLQFLFVVLIALYLWDCLVWVRRGGVAFRTWLGRPWRRRHPSTLFGNARGGFVFAPPLPPLGHTLLAAPAPFSVGASGVLAYSAMSLDALGRPPQSGEFLDWARVRELHGAGRQLRRAKHVFSRHGSAHGARHWHQSLLALARATEAERPTRLDALVDQTFNVEAVRQRWAQYRSLARPLDWCCNLYFGLLFGLAPTLVFLVGIRRTWPFLLGALVVLGVWTMVSFRRAHRTLFPAEEDDRFTQALILLLSPVSAVRARDVLTRPLFETSHPLAVGAVFLTAPDWRALARTVLREARHPRRPTAPAHPAEAATVEAEWRDRVTRAATHLARAQGVDPESLLAPPAPLDAECRSWCPHCEAQFTSATGVCRDCGELPLLPLAPVAPGPTTVTPRASPPSRATRALLAGGLMVGALAAAETPMLTIRQFQRDAARFGAVLTPPEFESTPTELRAAARSAKRRADRALDRMGRRPAGEVTFDNTLRAREEALALVTRTLNRAVLLKETHPEETLREAATAVVKDLKDWLVDVEYRADVFRAVQVCADASPDLVGEDRRLLDETLREARRAGLLLAPAARNQVGQWRKELARLCTDVSANLNAAEGALRFTTAELEGLPDAFLQHPEIRTDDGACLVRSEVNWQFVTVMEQARREDTRRRLKAERYRLATNNIPLWRQIVSLRATIARALGYASWADYQIEPGMAENAATVRAFLDTLRDGLDAKFREELAAMQQLKALDTGNPDARIEHWDWRFYGQRLLERDLDLDADALRAFFPYERVLAGMFRVAERCLGLSLQQLQPAAAWSDDVQLYGVSDAAQGEPLGLLYLDMFPRDGKYTHFAQFDLIPGQALARGRYQRPVAALVCNFPAPVPGRPARLSFEEVQTLFHEFGHALHALLTRVRYARFAGSGVPADFVEAPSTLLEHWARDPAVLDTFAADVRDPSRRIPPALLDRLGQARRATLGVYYRRQLSFGYMDLALHGPVDTVSQLDPVATCNALLAEVFLPPPDDTAFVASFGHLADGYDGAYYSYAWAEAIAADLAGVFRNAPGRFLDPDIGRRLRDEILASGGSRPVQESLRRFLGRDWSPAEFVRELGLPAAGPTDASTAP